MKKNIIIIGAGVSGLASGIRLLHEGHDVTIYDALPKSGGKMNKIEFEGFSFDLGPTIVMMPDIYNEVFTDVDTNPSDYYTMQKLETMYTVCYADGTSIDVSQDREAFADNLEAIAVGSSKQYEEYMQEMEKRFYVARDHFITKSFRSPRDFYNPKMLKHVIDLKTFSSAYKSISRSIKDEKIRQLVAFQTLYIGVSPFQGPSIYNIIPLVQSLYGVHYIQGGMYAYASALEKLFLERGGKIVHNAEVNTIVVEDKKATGIVIADEKIDADIVVNTADFAYALKYLLPENFNQQRYSRSNVDKLDYSASCVLVYAAVKGDVPKGVGMHTIFLSSQFEENIEAIFDGDLYEDSSVYTYIPAVKDQTLAPEGYFGLYILMPVPNLKDGRMIDWNNPKMKQDVTQMMYKRLRKNEAFADIVARIEEEKILTPNDFQSKFYTLYGETFGLRPSLLQSNYYRPQPKAWNTENLYFAGASIHPGAGVPIVLTSAKLAVEEMIRDVENEHTK